MSELGFIVLIDIYIRPFLNSAWEFRQAEFTSQTMRMCSWGLLDPSESSRGKGEGVGQEGGVAGMLDN